MRPQACARASPAAFLWMITFIVLHLFCYGENPANAADEVLPINDSGVSQVTYAERNEDSEIILELLLDDGQTILDPGVVGYLVDETVLLPLGKFTELLEFPITVDTGKGTASGWFMKPEKTFNLQYPFKSVDISGKQITIKTGIAEAHLDDIYVSQDLLTAWFPVELTLNYGELRLYLKPRENLPFQERAKRRGRWQSPQKTIGADINPEEIIRLPYRMFSAPSIEFNHGYTHSRSDAGSISGTSHSFNAEGEAFYMDGRLSLGYLTSTDDRDEIQNINLYLSKEDYAANLLGPLKATRFEIGDISSGSFPLAGSMNGRGASVTNEPYNFVRDPNSFRIEGFGPVGWDVEVFQDLELLAFAEISADGRYSFDTLPLGEGFNIFKIVLYGPNGEKEERYERFYLGQNMVEEGKFIYNGSLIQSSSPIFDVSATKATETEGTASFMGEYGLTNYLSVMGGYYHGPISDSYLDGAGFGLRTSGGSTYAQLNTFFDKSGGQSSSVLVTGNIDESTTFNIQHKLDREYPTDYYTTTRSTTAQVSRLFNFKNEILPSISMTLQAGKEEENTGRERMVYLNRMTTNFLGMNLSNEIERSVYSDTTEDTHEGRFSGRARTPFGILRGDLLYSFHQPLELETGILSLQTEITPWLSVTNGVTHGFDTDGITSFNTSLDWKLEKVRLGLAGSFDNRKNRQIGFTVGYSLIPQSTSGRYMLASRTDDVNSGRLLLRPFIDDNGNSFYDESETALQNIGFRNALRGTNSVTGDDGYSILPGLSPSLANKIIVDEKTITDLYTVPVKKEIYVLGKRGVNGPLDMPFNRLGEIAGNIFAPDESGEVHPLDAVHMKLIGADGKEVADTYSEFDGYFSFAAIPVGKYEIFLPASAPLQGIYSGDGDGPNVEINAAQPEKSDLQLIVETNRIYLKFDENAGQSANEIEKILP